MPHNKFRSKATPWDKKRNRPYGNYVRVQESSETAHAAARVMAAEMAIEQGRCPNGCGDLKRSACRSCGFAHHVYPPQRIDPRPNFHRRATRSSKGDRPA